VARSLARRPEPGSITDVAASIEHVAGDRAGDNGCRSTEYRSSATDLIDDTVSYYSHQSLKMQYVGDGAAQK
jgi:hypothetical protein